MDPDPDPDPDSDPMSLLKVSLSSHMLVPVK